MSPETVCYRSRVLDAVKDFLLPHHEKGQQLTETPVKPVAAQAAHRAQEARP